jgi:hypothetical protein
MRRPPVAVATVAVLALVATACGGGGPSHDDLVKEANAVCGPSVADTADLDPPTTPDEAPAYADDAREIVNDRLLALDELDVPSDDESAFTDYLDGLQDQRDALVDLSETEDPAEIERLVGDIADLEEQNADLADELDLNDCADAEEGTVLAAALEGQDQPAEEPTDDTVTPPDTGDDEVLQEGELPPDPVQAAELIGLAAGNPYSGETQDVTNETGALRMTVPTEWIDVDGTPSEDGTPNLDATPDIDAFVSSFDVPGVLFAAAPGFNDQALEDIISRFTPEACTPAGTGAYSDPAYTGIYGLSIECGGTNTAGIVIAARADDGTHSAMLQIALASEEDIGPMEEILRTFFADGNNMEGAP